MKFKYHIAMVLLVGFLLCSTTPPAATSPMMKQEKEEKESELIIIPEKVKSIFEEGIETREVRLDIPFSIAWNIFLPARQNVHSVFCFKVKNADLGFIPNPEAEAMLKTSGHIFIQFNRLEDSDPNEMMKEVYIPYNFQVMSEGYNPDEEDLYTVSYPLPPGDYLLSMAIASLDLEKIGTQYFEFSLPDPSSYTERLETTPLFFIRNMKRTDAAETKAEVHKDFFTYSVLQVEPNIDRVFNAGENLDIFFFIYGTSPKEGGKYDIEVNYEVFKGEERVIRYATAHYENPLVSQPLPMKKTVVIKTEKEGEKTETTEQRDIEPGQYTLHIDITDNISGNAVKKTVGFEVKEKAE